MGKTDTTEVEGRLRQSVPILSLYFLAFKATTLLRKMSPVFNRSPFYTCSFCWCHAILLEMVLWREANCDVHLSKVVYCAAPCRLFSSSSTWFTWSIRPWIVLNRNNCFFETEYFIHFCNVQWFSHVYYNKIHARTSPTDVLTYLICMRQAGFPPLLHLCSTPVNNITV